MSARVLREGRVRLWLDPEDRGLAYGDGLFETMLVHRGEPVWWQEHWQRLRRGAVALGLPMPDESEVRRECAALLAEAGEAGRVVLKLVLTRGSGGRGYAPPADATPTVVISTHPAPLPAATGLTLRWSRTTLAIQPALAGIKHLNRLEQVLARAEWDDPGIDEALMCDSEDRVVSATAANLFALVGGRWLTPSVERCGVAGVARHWLLSNLPGAAVAELSAAEVSHADALLLCNSVRGILPVRRLGMREWPRDDAVAPLRARLAEAQPAFADREH
jgi:4-amino-4-deoxychorismate lyase